MKDFGDVRFTIRSGWAIRSWPPRARWLGALLLLWAGVMIGVSFIAIPALFLAGSVPRATAFATVGEIFHLFVTAQMLVILALLALMAIVRPRRLVWHLVAIASIMVLIQYAWLLPDLMERADMILAGREPPPSYLHALFRASELLKLICVLVAGLSVDGRPKEAEARQPARGA